MRARKKTVIVEVFQLNRDYPDVTDWPDWFREAVNNNEIVTHQENVTNSPFERQIISADIHTLEGIMHADIHDYIIKGVNEEFYPCKPDIFGKTYEVIEDD